MVTVKRAPKDLKENQVNAILNSVFNGDIYYSNQSLIDKLNVSIKEVDDGYQISVKRSQNQPWDRNYSAVLTTLLPTKDNNGWSTIVSASVLNSEIISESVTEVSEVINPVTDVVEEPTETVNEVTSEKPIPKPSVNTGDPIINSFLEKGFDICQAGELAKGVKAGLDISSYEKLDMPWTSMLSHRLYLERHKGYK